MLDHILPSDFYESMEGVWESERTVNEVRVELLSLGFEENEDFEKIILEDYDVD